MIKKKIIIIFLLLVGITFVLVGVINSSTNTKKQKEENIKKVYPFTGLYTNNEKELYVYQNDEEKVYFTSSNEESYGFLIIDKNDKNIANGQQISTKYQFTLKGDTIEIESDDDYLQNLSYKKKRNITAEELFETRYGEMEYFNNEEYNGLYTSDIAKIYMYQYKDNEIRLIIDGNNGSMSRIPFFIDEEGNIMAMNTNANLSIYLNEDTLVFLYSPTEEETNDTRFDGVYTKERKLDVMDIIANRVTYWF